MLKVNHLNWGLGSNPATVVELISIIWLLQGQPVYLFEVHQINSAQLNTSAAEIWQYWFWLWAEAAAVNAVLNGFKK